jgi:hypothetical protein
MLDLAQPAKYIALGGGKRSGRASPSAGSPDAEPSAVADPAGMFVFCNPLLAPAGLLSGVVRWRR